MRELESEGSEVRHVGERADLQRFGRDRTATVGRAVSPLDSELAQERPVRITESLDGGVDRRKTECLKSRSKPADDARERLRREGSRIVGRDTTHADLVHERRDRRKRPSIRV